MGLITTTNAQPRKETRSTSRIGRLLALVGLVSVVLWRAASFRAVHHCHEETAMAGIVQGGVTWTKCDDVILCGHLEVPLDYHNESSGTAVLALAKYPANSKESRLGTIFLNPGGPGGSGVRMIYSSAHNISALVDGRYDIVSWDPRGINGTTPRIECFPSQTDQDIFYIGATQEAPLSIGNLSDSADFAVFLSQLKLQDARNEALVHLCLNRTGSDVLKTVGTATVVRDLELLARTLEPEDKVNYWGFSYGTVVGSYFVNMFPERVGKVVIDGVVDPMIWTSRHSATWGADYYQDAQKVLRGFVLACAEAGPARCALATDTSTPDDILARIEHLLDDLYERPLPVPHAKRPGALTKGHVVGYLFMTRYIPRGWAVAAKILKSAMEGDGAPILDVLQNEIHLDRTIEPQTAMAFVVITCLDAPPYSSEEREGAIDEMIVGFLDASKVSPNFPEVQLPDVCHLWPMEADERFVGPFNSTLSNDILVIGNTYDPVTPLASARRVHSALKQSFLIHQDGFGHCSLAQISLCTARTVRDYFLEGKLPKRREIVCPVSERPFPGTDDLQIGSSLASGEVITEENKRLLEILQGLQSDFEDLLATHFRIRY